MMLKDINANTANGRMPRIEIKKHSRNSLREAPLGIRAIRVKKTWRK